MNLSHFIMLKAPHR